MDEFIDEYDQELFLDDVDPTPITVEEKTERLLRFKDYSLNSPIILDDLTSARSLQKQQKTNSKITKSIKRLTHLYSNNPSAVPPERNTQHMFKTMNLLKSKYHQLKTIDPVLLKIKDLKTLLFSLTPSSLSVTDAFFKGMLNLETIHEQSFPRFLARLQHFLSDDSSDASFYWTMYKIFEGIVLLLNHQSETEYLELKNNLLQHWQLSKREEEGSIIIQCHTDLLGEIEISVENGCSLHSLQLVLDHNQCLMWENLFSNRFYTLLLLSYPDEKYTYNLPPKVADLYKAGDDVLANLGNKGYDLIKMIEPMCNYQIKSMSEKDPTMIQSPDFKTYIDNEVASICKKHGKVAWTFLNRLTNFDSIEDYVFVYGLFRHWGHPFIEYFEGLEKLHHNVTVEKEIDNDYVQKLASDLARKIINQHFRKTNKWPIIEDKLADGHILKKHVRDNTWPNRGEERLIGDTWNTLPLEKIYDIPTSLHLSEILDDKSHSLGRAALRASITEKNSVGFTKDRKVILSTLYKEEMDIAQFLDNIDKNGLDKDDLVIGLRAKERELKRIGRFFSLMTFNLRIYFVVTEAMIAKHILPLFPSITMTNSLLDVFKKMSACVPGHGDSNKEYVTYAEHFDYEKWNNHQRYESTAPIFEVIDKAFGYSNLIKRTHEIFQQSWIYFANKPELIGFKGDEVYNKDPKKLVCWNGQAGGLEGLRQKGWSVISMLMIERESKNRNPTVRTLAQGDNQVVCISYKLHKNCSPEDHHKNMIDIYKNRTHLVNGIYRGAKRLGLIIKPDESWSSTSYLVYGKFALVNGNLLCSEGKRFSRINIVSNDLVQTLSNCLSSVVTTCLTVCQQSDDITKTIHLYSLFGTSVIKSTLLFNVGIGQSLASFEQISKMDIEITKILYLDSSLGGIGGSSLLRFTIRQFPDSVTESLTFWKMIHDNTENKSVKILAIQCGNPRLKEFETMDLMKLIESPTSLNCETYSNISSVLKNLIREELFKNIDKIKHGTLKECIEFSIRSRDQFIRYLRSIRPVFPRFISNFYSSSIFGYTDSVVGLVQNSRTIRLLFSRKFSTTLAKTLIKNEVLAVSKSLQFNSSVSSNIWECSSKRADLLRERSWGPTIGATIPHPAELLKFEQREKCVHDHHIKDYVTCWGSIPVLLHPPTERGPCKPYLGSTTSDYVELYNAYEKKTENIVLKKAVSLRNAIGWFIADKSNLHNALCRNLQLFTDEDCTEIMAAGPKRSGSFIHRYINPRQSHGGFSATNYNKLQHIICTTDTMSDLNTHNWTFMYQSVILYTQIVFTSTLQDTIGNAAIHGHINCNSCLIEAKDEELNTTSDFPELPPLSRFNHLFIPKEKYPFVVDQKQLSSFEYVSGEQIAEDMAYHIGSMQGFLYVIKRNYTLLIDDLSSLFPKSVYLTTDPKSYLFGLLSGIIRGVFINSLTQQFIYTKKDRKTYLDGKIYTEISNIDNAKGLNNMTSEKQYVEYLSHVSHINTPDYPLKNDQALELLKVYFCHTVSKNLSGILKAVIRSRQIVLFPEILTSFIAASYALSIPLVGGCYLKNNFSRKDVHTVKMAIQTTDTQSDLPLKNLYDMFINNGLCIKICNEDMRTASKKSIRRPYLFSKILNRYSEYEGKSNVALLTTANTQPNFKNLLQSAKRRYCPLISGLRLVQFQTGAHYKLKCLLKYLHKAPQYAICAGDFSGGFSSTILRKYPTCQVVFNSLLELKNLPEGGIQPAPPSAITRLGPGRANRCINLYSVWEHPTDLTDLQSWYSMINLIPNKACDLITVDAEVHDAWQASIIAKNVQSILHLLNDRIQVVYKCFYSWLSDPDYTVLNILCSTFDTNIAAVTEFTGGFSSEFYLICSNIRRITDPRFPDPSSLLQLSDIVCCTNPPEQEFVRAMQIDLSNVLQGFSSDHQIDSGITVMSLCSSIGIHPSIGAKVYNLLHNCKDIYDFISSIGTGVCYIGKELTVTTEEKIGLLEVDPVPGPDFIEGIHVMILGYWYFCSWLLNNFSLYNSLIDLFHFKLYYKFDQTLKKFFWSHANKYNRFLNINIDRRKHHIATWIRAFTIIFWESGFSKPRVIDQTVLYHHIINQFEILKYLNFNLPMLREQTNLLEVMWFPFSGHAYSELLNIPL
ncbi:L protein [Eptesicus fuscus rhabdovirus]|uniref:RNA-directed RNA polymerase L n=1 Tax=Eptesicus fuscus rhabdovirus TaxID=2793798 RepID=A0A7T1KMT7_9RHAB|nr:L protein [Eptesicus fuscus rhabdovirus]